MREPEASGHADAGFFLPGAIVINSTVPLHRSQCRLPIENAWVEFLKDYEWQWFATLTFKDATHPEAAGKRFSYWTRLLDDAHGVAKKKRADHPRRCFWARGLEWQKRDVLHFHAVIGNIPSELDTQVYRFSWAESWLNLGNTGLARIWPVESAAGVVQYISKYCAKGGEVDLSASLALAQSKLREAVA